MGLAAACPARLFGGVPLINGVWDRVRNHMALGLARLTVWILTIVAIATGLFCVTALTGVAVPVGGRLDLLPLPEDAAVAAIGFALLFNLPPLPIWAGMLRGALSHATRTGLMALSVSMAPATLAGAAASHTPIAETKSLILGSTLTMGAIAIGLAVPLALLPATSRGTPPDT